MSQNIKVTAFVEAVRIFAAAVVLGCPDKLKTAKALYSKRIDANNSYQARVLGYRIYPKFHVVINETYRAQFRKERELCLHLESHDV